MKRSLVILSFLLLSSGALSGCSNTFHGMGQDMERNGQAIQNSF